MHVTVNMDGARRCCSVVLIMGHRVKCGIGLRLVELTPFTFIPRDDKTAKPCPIFKINNSASLGAIII